ncbi:hypothetical protein QN326_04690 [Candidatus Phytoplasma asteris]|uniref:Sequence-variable mosaic (SVM) signal sequence domain-containing protein n=1 Tax=Candidatus Phytoplasma asteris TaxID=85620 RepID=A0ABZ3CF48_9MOLU
MTEIKKYLIYAYILFCVCVFDFASVSNKIYKQKTTQSTNKKIKINKINKKNKNNKKEVRK